VLRLAIIGATGKVGSMMLTSLQEMGIPYTTLDLYASAHSAGKKVEVDQREIVIKELTFEISKQKYDYILVSAGKKISLEYMKSFLDTGSIVIDNSSAFRQKPDIPLVIPEINGHLLKNYSGLVANPNCSTIQLLLIINSLYHFQRIKKVVVTTMQSVSGAGYKGIIELYNQRKGSKDFKVFPKPIDLNVIPQIGEIRDDRYCDEEDKMTYESRKILGDQSFNLVATTVRVPVVYGHSESVYVEFYTPVDLQKIEQLLGNTQSVCVDQNYITPLEIGESEMSHLSRIRYAGDRKSILFWNIGHNIRLGAATNAVKILKECVSYKSNCS